MIDWSNIVSITENARQAGVDQANLADLALFTHERPLLAGYGEHRAYRNSAELFTDFGSDSFIARMAGKVFSQAPNLVSGGGSLIVIPLLGNTPNAPAVITVTNRSLEQFPEKGVITVNIGSQQSVIPFVLQDRSSMAAIQNGLNDFFTEYSFSVAITGTLQSATLQFTTATTGSVASIAILETQSPDDGYVDIAVLLNLVDQTAVGADNGKEQLKEAVLRTIGRVNYFGIIFDEASNIPYANSRLREVAELVQELNKILFVATNSMLRVQDNFAGIAAGGFTKTRCLYFGGTEQDALLFQAAYAGRGLATNYNGAGTAFTMQMKTLAGISPDDSIDQTRYNILMQAGADCYPNFGIPKVATSGKNRFFDVVMYEIAIKLEYLRSLVNSLATTPTKIPQTNSGVGRIISNAISDLTKFQTAGITASGVKWNGEVPVPVDEDIFQLEIMKSGIYVWFDDVNNQSQSDREQRITPPGSLSIKFSGAFHEIQSTINFEN